MNFREGDRVRLIEAPNIIGVVVRNSTLNYASDVGVRWLFTGHGVAANDTRSSCIELVLTDANTNELEVGDRYTRVGGQVSLFTNSCSLVHFNSIIKIERIGSNGWATVWEKS